MYKLLMAVTVALLLWGHGGASQADGGWTAEQLRVIGKIYAEAERWGLRDVDRDLMLRIAYRETGFGLNRSGDHSSSIGVFQWHIGGVWQSTPCFAEYGWAGRYVEDADIDCAAWAFNRGLQSHWSPTLHVRWLATVPSDPRIKGD